MSLISTIYSIDFRSDFSPTCSKHIPLSDEFLVCIFYHNLLYIILFHILHFKLIHIFLLDRIYRCYKEIVLFGPFYVIVVICLFYILK